MTLSKEASYTSADGLKLFYRDFGDSNSSNTPVLCVPGLTRNSRDFIDLAQRLSADRRVMCPDLRGRGFSDYDPNYKNYQPVTYVADMIKLLDDLGIEKVIWIGTSLGGIMAMVAALRHPERLAGVVLNDIGPVLAEAGLNRIKSYTGKLPPVTSWQDAIDQAKQVYGDSLRGLDEARWPDLVRRNYREDENGVPKPDMDPKIGDAMRESGGAIADPWPIFQGLIPIPTLALRGELSDLLDEETFEEMGNRKPDLIRVTVPDRGHTPLLDEPACLEAIDAFVRGL
ncbi:MAG: alpha/beta hydrolase [Proteobacteria bacterium]|nr:alpha/beta hydrolase [Pseudomonadota bacterium]